MRAVMAGCLPALLRAAALVNAQGASVIDAVHKGHAVGHEQDGVDAVCTALASGGNVNERDQFGWTPLMWAALECRADILKYLLDSGADVRLRAHTDRRDSFLSSGQNAILVASGCFIARRRAGLAPERHMPSDYVAYELAATAKMVRELIAHGARVDETDVYGRTPLMMAAMQGWSDAAGELIDAKAAVNARDREGRLAIDYVDPADTNTFHVLNRGGSRPATGKSGRTVCDAERALHMLIVDCIAGRDDRANVMNFQQEHGLPTSGELDSTTRLRSLVFVDGGFRPIFRASRTVDLNSLRKCCDPSGGTDNFNTGPPSA